MNKAWSFQESKCTQKYNEIIKKLHIHVSNRPKFKFETTFLDELAL